MIFMPKVTLRLYYEKDKSEFTEAIMSLKEKAKKLKSDIPAVFLALKDKETPIFAKVFAAITVMYALSPVDLVPDFIPILGYLDDIIILPALVILTVKFIPNEVWERSRKTSVDLWKDGKPKKWYYAIPIVLIWFVMIWLIIKVIWL